IAIDLYDLQRHAATDHLGHIGLLLRLRPAADTADLRGWHEATHAIEINQQTAFVIVDHLGFDHLVGIEALLEPAPALLLPGLVYRKNGTPFAILGLDHED